MKKMVVIATLMLCGALQASEQQEVPRQSPAPNAKAPLTGDALKKCLTKLQITGSSEQPGNALFSPRYGIVLTRQADEVARRMNHDDPATAATIQAAAESDSPKGPEAAKIMRRIKEYTGDLSSQHPSVSLFTLMNLDGGNDFTTDNSVDTGDCKGGGYYD